MTFAEIYDEYFLWGWVCHDAFVPLSDDDDDGDARQCQFVGHRRSQPSEAYGANCDAVDAMSDAALDPVGMMVVADSDSLVSLW